MEARGSLMARQRSALYVDQIKELVNQHVTQMNSIIRGANEVNDKHQKERLERLLNEALAVLELDVLIQEHLSLAQRQRELRDRFKLMVGESADLNRFLPENRSSLLTDLAGSSRTIPELIYEEMDLAGRRHGITPNEVRTIPYLQAGPLVDELKQCQTQNEVISRLNRNQGKVLEMLGIRPEDILKLLQQEAMSPVPNPPIPDKPGDDEW
jgi:hypothetical protein